MAYDAPRSGLHPSWLRASHGVPTQQSIAPAPVNRFMPTAQRFPPPQIVHETNASAGQFGWQAGPDFMSVYDTSRLRGAGMGQMSPAWFGGYDAPMNAQSFQDPGIAPGMIVERATVPFDPNSPSPFIDRVQLVGPRNHGVIKIQNIPYGITMAEVHQFICKHVAPSDLLQPHQDGFPLHIVMERSTGKTMDAFVEVNTPEIAEDAIERNFRGMKHPRLGQRHVIIETSSQGELLHELFPRSRSVVWEEAKFGAPRLIENHDAYSSGFKSFMTEEELSGMIRHAEAPQRSPFAIRSLQRTFECMISTLYKFPWYADTLYKMSDRDVIWHAYEKLLNVLVQKVVPGQAVHHSQHDERPSREVGLDNKLVMDFIFAGMNCPGFSERQKYAIINQSAGAGRGIYLSQHAQLWPFQTLGPHPANISDQDLGMWLHIFELGLNVYKNETPGVPVGIAPHLELENLGGGKPVVRASESGMQLSRRAFQTLEKALCDKLVKKGWLVYLGQYGLHSDSGNEDGLALSDIVESEGEGDISPGTLSGGHADASGPGPAIVTSAGNFSNAFSQLTVSDSSKATSWPGFITPHSALGFAAGVGSGHSMTPPGEDTSRISTARRNSNITANPAHIPPHLIAPLTTPTPPRINRAIEIRNPDGTPLRADPPRTLSFGTTSTSGSRAGHDGNASTASVPSTPGDNVSGEDNLKIRVVTPPPTRHRSGFNSSFSNDHGRVPSDASSIFNTPAMRSIRGSPSRSSPGRDVGDTPTSLTPSRSTSTSANASPNRSLRRMSGTTVSPTRHVSRSIVSSRISPSPKQSMGPSYSRESSFGSILNQSGGSNPFNGNILTTPTKGTGVMSRADAAVRSMLATGVSDFARPSPSQIRSYGMAIGTTTPTRDPSDVEAASNAAAFDPGPIGSGPRSVSSSSTGTVVRRTVKFAPADTIVEDKVGEGYFDGGGATSTRTSSIDAQNDVGSGAVTYDAYY